MISMIRLILKLSSWHPAGPMAIYMQRRAKQFGSIPPPAAAVWSKNASHRFFQRLVRCNTGVCNALIIAMLCKLLQECVAALLSVKTCCNVLPDARCNGAV